MKIKITSEKITIEDNISKVSVTQVDTIMAALANYEEVKWQAVKIAGMWRITRDGRLVGNSRKFTKALSEATNLTIVSYV